MAANQVRTPAALITGSTAGIGKAIAGALAKEGYGIIVNGRRAPAEVEELIQQLEKANGRPGSCCYLRGDISDPTIRDEIAALVKKEYPGLCILVNNAGVPTAVRKDMLELNEEEMIRLLKINLIGPFLLTSALAPLLDSKTSPGYIVNISSISAYTVSTERADYCLSKAGMSMMTQLFAQRLAQQNVAVFEIRPGIIKTDMTAPVQEKYDRLIADGLLPIDRWGVPDDIAAVVTGISKGYYPYATGEVINIDGGFHIRQL